MDTLKRRRQSVAECVAEIAVVGTVAMARIVSPRSGPGHDTRLLEYGLEFVSALAVAVVVWRVIMSDHAIKSGPDVRESAHKVTFAL